MLTLNEIINEAIALPNTDKTTLIEKLMESMEPSDSDKILLNEAIQIAQKRLAEVEAGTVQTIPGEMALAQVRSLLD